MNASRSVFSVLAAALAAAGCVSVSPDAGPDRSLLLSETPATLARQCLVAESPARLPRADVLVDSATLQRDVAELVPTGESGYVLLSMVYDSTGVNIRRSVIEHGTRPMIADSIQRLVFQHRRELSVGEHLGVRLRLNLGPEVSMQVGRQELCPPAPLDPTMESSLVHFRSAGARYVPGQRERTVWVRVYVNSSGSVVATRVERGGLGGLEMERQLFDVLRRFSFRPATEDGLPVPGDLLVPIRMRVN